MERDEDEKGGKIYKLYLPRTWDLRLPFRDGKGSKGRSTRE